MSDKIKLEFVSDILFYKCACVGDDWEEKYKDNQTVLDLISKLVSAETPEDDGISEAMEELINRRWRVVFAWKLRRSQNSLQKSDR